MVRQPPNSATDGSDPSLGPDGPVDAPGPGRPAGRDEPTGVGPDRRGSVAVAPHSAGPGIVEREPTGVDIESADPGPAEHADAAGAPLLRLLGARAVGPATAVLVAATWWAVRSLELAGRSPGAASVWVLGAGAVALVVVVLASFLARRVLVAERDTARLRQRPLVDDLTGLANRAGITADIDRRLADRGPGDIVAVLFCDLDRLKVVNDSLGHAAGDEVLVVAARRLTSVVRATDSVGRFGGDEFVIVTSGLPAIRDLEILADRITETLRQPTVLADGSAQVVSGSIGIAYVAGDQPTAAGDLLRDADAAMYRSKGEGGARHTVFDDSLRAEAVARLELEQELRVGIRDDQIAVHYQPIVDVSTGRIERVEALIRWLHPERGTILPSQFLPVAAESQLMVDLGRIVLAQACEQAMVWSATAGRPVTVAVNVAERQLLDLGLVDSVTRALAETGLPAAQLELEVSEELILERFDRSLVVLRQLDLLGVRLAIDDFGTSQASLSRLKQLAMVSTLKIDRSFVDGIATDPVDARIVAAIVALAESVGMGVVAEGVESGAQARVLADLGVEHLQGFLFLRPVPAAELAAGFAEDHRLRW